MGTGKSFMNAASLPIRFPWARVLSCPDFISSEYLFNWKLAISEKKANNSFLMEEFEVSR